MLRAGVLVMGLWVFGSAGYADSQARSTLNAEIVPEPLIKAMQSVHGAALAAPLKSALMFRYVYFKEGICRDQDCSSSVVEETMKTLKTRMGSDFAGLSTKYDQYLDEVKISQLKSRTGDVDSLLSARSASEILARGTFLTCVDYVKTVASLAIANGMVEDDLRFFWMMDKAGHSKMCPVQDGRSAKLPRPLSHSVVAYRMDNQWYLMNVENPNPEIIPVGTEVPTERFSRQFIFQLPAMIGGKVLSFAGAYPVGKFLDGFSGKWISNITASGRISADDSDFVCQKSRNVLANVTGKLAQ